MDLLESRCAALRYKQATTYTAATVLHDGRGRQICEEQMIKEKVTFDRTAQLDKLNTRAHQDGVAMAHVILCLLHRADALCELAEETGADITRVQGAFQMEGTEQ
jgi:hypothetical protein